MQYLFFCLHKWLNCVQGLMPSDIECTFTPKVDPAAYSINIANDIMLSLVLNPDKKYVSFSS